MDQWEKDFELFTKSFLFWCDKLQLKKYNLATKCEELKDNQAEVRINHEGKLAVAILNKIRVEREGHIVNSPESNGKHEAIHLFLSRLSWLGSCRFLMPEDMPEEEEFLTNVLEKLL